MDFDAVEARLRRLRREGRYRAALDLIGEHSADLAVHTVRLEYWRACLLAASGHGAAALTALQRVVDAGHWYSRQRLESDEDLALVRAEPAFEELLAASAALETRARRAGPPSPLLVVPDAAEDAPLLVAFHPAASRPDRAVHPWDAAVRAGWAVVMPYASQPVASDSYVWLDRSRSRLDAEAAGRALRDALAVAGVPDSQGHERRRALVLAGFGQGGAVALLLGLRRWTGADAVLLVGASARHAEAVDAATVDGPPAPTRVRAIAGQEDPNVDATRQAMRDLREHGFDVSLEVRADLGHQLPPDFDTHLVECLDELRSR